MQFPRKFDNILLTIHNKMGEGGQGGGVQNLGSGKLKHTYFYCNM